jgi:hypothetical protein
MSGSFKVTNNLIAQGITHIASNFGIRVVGEYEEKDGKKVLKSMKLVSVDFVSDKGSVGDVIKKKDEKKEI